METDRAALIAAVRESIYADARAALDLGALRRSIARGDADLDTEAAVALVAAVVDCVHRNGQITHLLYALIAETPTMPTTRARVDDAPTDPTSVLLARVDIIEERAKEDRAVQQQILASLVALPADMAAARAEASSDSHAIGERIAKIEGAVAVERERGKAVEECIRGGLEKLGKVAEKIAGDKIALGMVILGGLLALALVMGGAAVSGQAISELTGIVDHVAGKPVPTTEPTP